MFSGKDEQTNKDDLFGITASGWIGWLRSP